MQRILNVLQRYDKKRSRRWQENQRGYIIMEETDEQDFK